MFNVAYIKRLIIQSTDNSNIILTYSQLACVPLVSMVDSFVLIFLFKTSWKSSIPAFPTDLLIQLDLSNQTFHWKLVTFGVLEARKNVSYEWITNKMNKIIKISKLLKSFNLVSVRINKKLHVLITFSFLFFLIWCKHFDESL